MSIFWIFVYEYNIYQERIYMQNEPKIILRSTYKNDLTYKKETHANMLIQCLLGFFPNFFLGTIFMRQNRCGDSV